MRFTTNKDKAQKIHERVASKSGACSVCSEWCVFKILDEYMEKEGPPEKCF